MAFEKPEQIEGRFPVRWLKYETDTESVKAELLQARPAFERLQTILDEKRIAASHGNQPDFLDAGWPYKSADINGYFRALDEIEKLIPKY